jgi:hypothetical protein
MMSSAGILAALAPLLGDPLSSVSGQAFQEEEVDVPYSLRFLGPSDFILQTKTWMSAGFWDDSIETHFYPYPYPERYAYLRCKWGRKEGFEGLALLIDDVTDTAEKPDGFVPISFDTYNMRMTVQDPSVPDTPGFYSAFIEFISAGGSLEDEFGYPAMKSMAPGNPFPNGTFYYTWGRMPSPVSNKDPNRLKPHTIYCFLISKSLLTSKYPDIGFQMRLRQTGEDRIYMGFPERGYATMRFSEVSVPEFQDYEIGRDLLGSMGLAILTPYLISFLRRKSSNTKE